MATVRKNKTSAPSSGNSFLNAHMAIGVAASTIERKVNSLLKEYNINHTDFMCLYLLSTRGGSSSIPEITAKTRLTRQAVSLTTRTLEKQGLIQRVGDKNDKRKLRIKLTDKGVDITRTVESSRGRIQMLDALTSILTAEEAEWLAQILNKISKKISRLPSQ